MTYPDIIVSGAGSTEVNGTYVWQEPPPELEGFTIYTLNGEPFDFMDDTQISIVYNPDPDYSGWYMGTGSQPRYYSGEHVATPDLVQTWYTFFGTPPVPTVEVGGDPPEPYAFDILVSGGGFTAGNGRYVRCDVPSGNNADYAWRHSVNSGVYIFLFAFPENLFYEWLICSSSSHYDDVYNGQSSTNKLADCTWTPGSYYQAPMPSSIIEAEPVSEHHISIGTIGATAGVGNIGVRQGHKIKPDAMSASANVGNVGVRQAHRIKPATAGATANVGDIGVRQAHAIDIGSILATGNVSDVGVKQTHIIKPETLSATANVSDIGVHQPQYVSIGNMSASANVSDIEVRQAHRMRIDDISVLANIGDIGIRQAHKITIGDIEVVTVIEPISIRQAHKISIGTLQAEINVSDIKVRQLLIVPVPQARQYRVKPEHRVFAVMSDNRVYEIAHEDRTLVITQ
ncbi:MAG: hypothetical protein ACOX8S_12475 [Christensenellales bacterium]|jgi:hypothetical protein